MCAILYLYTVNVTRRDKGLNAIQNIKHMQVYAIYSSIGMCKYHIIAHMDTICVFHGNRVINPKCGLGK